MNKEEVRQLLNNQSSKLFDDIVNSRASVPIIIFV